MDMTKATSASVTAAPQLGTAMSEGVTLGDVLKTGDRDWASIIHAAIMCIAFVIGFPLGIVALRVMGKVMWHAWVQGVAVGFVTVGTGLGLYVGTSYNRVSVLSVYNCLQANRSSPNMSPPLIKSSAS